MDLISKIKNPVERGKYVTRSLNILGIRESDLISLIRAKRNRESVTQIIKTNEYKSSFEKIILKILLKYPDLAEDINIKNVSDYFEDERLKVILNRIYKNRFHDISSLLNSFEGSDYQELISDLVFSSDDLIDKPTSKKILDDCITRIELESINLKLKNIRFKIQEQEKSLEKGFEKELLAEYRDLVELEKSLRGSINEI